MKKTRLGCGLLGVLAVAASVAAAVGVQVCGDAEVVVVRCLSTTDRCCAGSGEREGWTWQAYVCACMLIGGVA